MGLKVLLDTHVLLWALMAPRNLSRRVRTLIENPDNIMLVSSASAWEIATKHRLGRLPEAETVVRGYRDHLETLRATEIAITSEHALLAGTLEVGHGDPFDRMLAAQAMIEGVPLITNDAAFKVFRVTKLW